MPGQDSALEVRSASRAAEVGRPRRATEPALAEPTVPSTLHRPHMRLLHGMRKPANWLQLMRFGLVGASGFVVNLAVYALCVHALGVAYQAAAVLAWLVAVTNNFVINRHWTFDASAGSIHFQALRFFLVSLIAFAFNLLLLTVFVEAASMAKVPAQAVAVVASTPLNFIGNKLWSFRVD